MIQSGLAMPRYRPIPSIVRIKSSASDLLAFRWAKGGIIADFAIPSEDDRALRVQFDRVEVVRILDEMALSTEGQETPLERLERDHLAYAVEGARFWLSQSETLKIVIPDLHHYCFVTGGNCIDVISRDPPRFSVATFAQDRPWEDGPDCRPEPPGRRSIVNTAHAMLDGGLSFIEGARQLSRLRYLVSELEQDPDILAFVEIDSKTGALPIGEMRKLWAPAALAKAQPEIDHAEKWAAVRGRPHCEALIARFSTQE